MWHSLSLLLTFQLYVRRIIWFWTSDNWNHGKWNHRLSRTTLLNKQTWKEKNNEKRMHMLSRVLCVSYHSQGRTKHFSITSWYGSHQRKHNTVKQWIKHCFTQRRDRARRVSVIGIGPPWQGSLSLKTTQGNWSMHTFLVP